MLDNSNVLFDLIDSSLTQTFGYTLSVSGIPGLTGTLAYLEGYWYERSTQQRKRRRLNNTLCKSTNRLLECQLFVSISRLQKSVALSR